ncbi:tyrosine protein phosphatase yvh1 [Bachmanniomyces sp. S44760]|nr:tyrosine protein phosphatase yvh1 [Bachmanniomyces sp. S44760]
MALDRIPGDKELYIGGIFSLRRTEALRTANITHVVSALRVLPATRSILDQNLLSPYEHLAVEVDDVDDENIMEHFATSNAFIQKGLDSGGGVLVHCAMGKSRSTTLIIAYLLSTASMPVIPSTVLASIRICRPIAEPNDGFMSQLDLYHRMGCPKDLASQPLYQRWLYHREVAASVACGKAPDMICFGDEYSTDDAASADAGANSQLGDVVQSHCAHAQKRTAQKNFRTNFIFSILRFVVAMCPLILRTSIMDAA